MTPSDRVVQAAHAWWRSKRPGVFSQREHLANGTVNCISDTERALASAVVASLCEQKRKRDGTR